MRELRHDLISTYMQTNTLDYLVNTISRFSGRTAITEKFRSITFGEMGTAAVIIAERIIQIANVKCEPIGVYLPRSIESVTSFAGILYSGNFYVPLDTKAPADRIGAILSTLSPKCIITNSKLLSVLLSAGYARENIVLLDDVTTLPTENINFGLKLRYRDIIDTDPVYVIFTSGSSGIPKGVTISHRSVIDYIDWANNVYLVTERDVIGNQAPFFFDNSTLDIYLCFSKGATLNIIPDEVFAFPVKLIEHMRDFGVTFIFWVPSLMTTIMNFDILSDVSLPSLDKVLFAGEVMPARTLNYWRRHLPNTLFSNLYGPTEITVDCTYYIVNRPIADDEPVPIGFPCHNSDIIILNEQDKQVSDGEIGELCVRGSSLALGYWNSPEKTAAAFTQNPLRQQYPERIYRTGDLVQINAHGEIVFIGRKDSQIKHLGYRIELGEIEATASRIEQVRKVCVLYNQNKREITLFYEANADIEFSKIRQSLMKSLPKYMLPTVFHRMDSLPRNPSGKIDRNKLASALV